MTLTEVNYYARKLAPLSVIGLLIILALFFAFRLLFLYLETQSTTPQVAAVIQTDPIFNKIKRPQIPETGTTQSFTFVLDTLDATTAIKNATSAANVYFVPKQSATFGFLTTIYSMAKAVGIDTEVTKHTLSGRTAEFNDGRNKLTINIDTNNFTYEYALDRDETLFDTETLIQDQQAESEASSFLSKIGAKTNEFSQGNEHIIYLRYDPESRKINQLDTSEGANMVEVDLYRPDLDGYPFVTTSYFNSPHYVFLAPRSGRLEVVRAQLKLFPKSEEQVGVYPIRSADQAYEDLKGGRGILISSDKPNGPVKIKKIFLAYYDPDVYQEYIQPVYVFLGENTFVAYVPAVTDEYLAQ